VLLARLGWGAYVTAHLARLTLIRELQGAGYTLAAVEEFLASLLADADPDAVALFVRTFAGGQRALRLWGCTAALPTLVVSVEGQVVNVDASWSLGAGLTGVVLLIVSVALARGGFHTRRVLRAVGSTDTTACGLVGQVALQHPNTRSGQLTQCVGRAGPGPAGLLTAPYSKQLCVWHRNTVVRTYQGRIREDNPSGIERTVESDTTSDAAFTLTDPTGTILVEPKGARLNLGTRVDELSGHEVYQRFAPADPAGSRRIGLE
jgi:hypothetical protein